MGSVRFTERFLEGDPPADSELQELAEAVRRMVPHLTADHAIAVAGTATSIAAIDGADQVHGYHLSLASCERVAAKLAGLTVEQRREVKGLHPDRAPTIVAGAVILTESVRSLGLNEVEVSDRDLLHGAVLTAP
jgi:exopolyphosphatase/guanosine-5'-triphosphate,3'-diphosphate pyrophosphatase